MALSPFPIFSYTRALSKFARDYFKYVASQSASVLFQRSLFSGF
jgi:hypothetical protein